MKQGRVRKNDRSIVVILPGGGVGVFVLDTPALTLEALQAFVDGNIEVVGIGQGRVMIVNEESEINGSRFNHAATALIGPGDVIFGVAVVAVGEGEEIVGLGDSEAMMIAREIVEKTRKRGDKR